MQSYVAAQRILAHKRGTAQGAHEIRLKLRLLHAARFSLIFRRRRFCRRRRRSDVTVGVGGGPTTVASIDMVGQRVAGLGRVVAVVAGQRLVQQAVLNTEREREGMQQSIIIKIK